MLLLCCFCLFVVVFFKITTFLAFSLNLGHHFLIFNKNSLNLVLHCTETHRKTSNFYMCLLNFISTYHFYFMQKIIYHLKRNWPRFSLPKFSRSSIYVITIVNLVILLFKLELLWVSVGPYFTTFNFFFSEEGLESIILSKSRNTHFPNLNSKS